MSAIFFVPASPFKFLQGPTGHAKISAVVPEDSRVLMARQLCVRPPVASKPGSSPPERPGPDQYDVSTMV